MSLLIWLPLIDDTENQGLANINMINHNATSNTAGKLGNCYQFNGSTAYINENSYDWTKFNVHQFTLCCWYKEPSPVASGNSQIIHIGTSSGWNNIRIGLLRRTSNGYPLFSVSDGTNNINYNFTATSFSLDVWHHIAVTYDNGKLTMYLDGQVNKTMTTTIVPVITASHHLGIGGAADGKEKLTGFLNDVRIYDTALSPREIKEISKGLVLHYPLSCVGQKNYINTVTIASVPSNGSTSIIEDGVKTNGLDKDTYFVIKLNTNLVAGTTYTLSFYAEGMTDGSALNFGLGAQSPSSTQYCGLVMVHNGFNTHVFTPNVAFSGQIIMDDTNRNGLPIVNMKYFKIEEGDIATPWCVSENDPRYTIMGMSDEIEYDVSGYSHNGTKTNTEFSSDTPRNIESLYFDGTSLIQANPLPSEVKTISVWCKTTKDKSTSQFICQDSASGLCVTFYKGTIISHLGSSSSTGSKCTLGESYIENGWNHFVVLKTGTHTREVYCNGVKLTPTSNDYWSPSTGFLIGARNTSNGLPFYGYISDLRAYTTLLSEEDIIELYHTPISLTASGALFAQGEYVEV